MMHLLTYLSFHNHLQAHNGKFDFIISTVSADFDINAYISLLGLNGQFIVVGAPPAPMQVAAFPLLMRRVSVAGSGIGGIRETQEMLDFCGKKNITCDIEKINASQINEAYERTISSDVKYRFVIDVSTI